MKKYISESIEDTLKIASDFTKTLKGGEVVLLDGVLGAGKTVFVKGVADALKIEDTVTSPSFSIMNVYEDTVKLYHFDLYRLDDLFEIEQLLMDYLYIPDSVVMIEWGYKAKDILKEFIFIDIRIEGDKRIITIDRVKS